MTTNVTLPPPFSPAALVDGFIGVAGAGNCLPGPYLPRGLVRLGPDTVFPTGNNGYTPGKPIRHFSHTHVAGTGGASCYGNIAVFPFIGDQGFTPGPELPRDEVAQAGYYSATLQPSGIRCELTSTHACGLHRYTFPSGSVPQLLVDLGAVLAQAARPGPGDGMTARSIGGTVEMVSPTELHGRGDYRGCWGHDRPYSVFFYARLDTPATLYRGIEAGVYIGPPEPTSADGGATVAAGPQAKLHIRFATGTREVVLRVGISYTSVAQARTHLETEAGTRSFDELHQSAIAAWNQALGRLRVSGGDGANRVRFYSLYQRLLCQPADLGVEGEWSWWRSPTRKFSDLYVLWDAIRNATSFFLLTEPEFFRDFLNWLLDAADHLGFIPGSWMAGHAGCNMGSNVAALLFSEAAQKGLTGIDYAKALTYLAKDVENDTCVRLHGRAQRVWRNQDCSMMLGLSHLDFGGASGVIEYAQQDFAIAQLAEHVGDRNLALRFHSSARRLWQLWRDDATSFAPKDAAGRWIEPFYREPRQYHYKPSWSWWNPYFTEDSANGWTFNVQQDIPGLIARLGGPEAFIERLDECLQDPSRMGWKETTLHVPYLYHYVGRPDLTARAVHETLESRYGFGPGALPDNEDMGCQSAFVICAQLGLYPCMGQDLYWLSAPAFPAIDLDLGASGNVLRIRADSVTTPDWHCTRTLQFVRRAWLNGQPLTRAWVRHRELVGGAELRFELGDTPAEWGVRELPPSPAVEAAARLPTELPAWPPRLLTANLDFSGPPLRAWHLLGAYPSAKPLIITLDEGQPGVELNPGSVDLQASHAGTSWQPASAAPTGFVSLDRHLGRLEWHYAYAYTEFDAPAARDAVLGVGSDDGVRMWLNGELVHSHDIGRGFSPNSDRVPVRLRQGRNRLLLKITNQINGWGFSVQVG